MVAKANMALVRLLNTTANNQIVNLDKIEYEPLENYDVIKSDNTERTDNVLKKLKKYFPPLFKNTLEKLCI